MLAAAQVQRFVRQILIPEVGRAGQERWVESQLDASGGGPALEAAVELVKAAGVRLVQAPGPVPAAQLGSVWLSDTAFADERSACAECLAAFFAAQPAAGPDDRAAVAFAVGAGAAGEALLRLLDPVRQPIAMVFTPEPRRASVPRAGCACEAA